MAKIDELKNVTKVYKTGEREFRALDSATGVEVLKLLMEQCRKGGNTVIIVTHNSLIADIADTVVRVKNGKIKSVVDNASPKAIEEVEW